MSTGRETQIAKQILHPKIYQIVEPEPVKKFLGENGIPLIRMRTVGYGCSRMLYPNTFEERLAQKNRRVELKVLEF